ncbi:LemA family protein [Rikenella microfusus]|nr:LemA family protein [Rikenella microfusus]HJE88377.1 LemA family protein [Rikenella microfusus]
MNGPLILSGTLLLILAFFALWVIVTSNQLILKRNRVKQCRSGICVALKQRNDLIPNLVATVKTYMQYEDQTLRRITELRAEAENTPDEQEQIEAGNRLSSLLPELRLTAEAYPDLKADRQFLRLQESLEELERQLQAIRRTYNAAVVDYNNYVEMFPSSWVAQRKGHRCEALIDIPEAEQEVADVNRFFK